MKGRTAAALVTLLAITFGQQGGWAEPVVGSATIKGKVICKGRRDNRDAVVYIEKLDGQFKPPEKALEMDQVKMKFIPHVMPVVVGTTVKFLNSDPVLHNIFTPSKAGDRFNLGSWPQGEVREYKFSKLGPVRLLCNVHPEMLAWVIALQNPYFAATKADGLYSIPNVPAGDYVLKVWHERLKPVSQTVTVPESGALDVDFTISR